MALVADAILLLHALFIGFVVFSLVLIMLGKVLDWGWVRNFWFRVIHLMSILFVMLQSWLGLICPLTLLEMEFRLQAGDHVYTESFVSHWLGKLVYIQASPWVFVVGYTLFCALVLVSWFLVRPKRGQSQ